MRRTPLLIGLAVFIGVFASFVSLNSFAQDAGFLRTDLISPSPTATQLAKYGEIPVTYYTGLPNVSIHIFNVTGNELSLPITLTYNNSGAQPGQKASWVGLGWSLQAGGVITRSVGDRLDKGTGYDIDSASQLSPTQGYLKRSRYHGLNDNLPDVYSFNFGNYSGKFIYEHGNYYIMPKQKLKIIGSGYGEFVITGEDGTKYHFNALEYTTAKPSSPGYNVPQHVSAWYLTKITNATDTESIYLSYAQDGTMEQFGVRSQSYKKPISEISQMGSPSPPADVLPTRVTIQRLASIYSDKYQVDFLVGGPRQDLTMVSGAANSLGAIKVYSKDGQVKNFTFTYDYSPTPGIALRLKSLNEHSLIGGNKQHTFSYYNEDQSMGSGISSPVDKFGYLKSGGNNMLISNEVYQYGADRTPTFNTQSIGTLKTLTYPTGGSTTFTYEPNRYNDGDKNIFDARVAESSAVRNIPSTENLIYAIDTLHITHTQMVKFVYTRWDKQQSPYDPLVHPQEVWHDNVQEFEIRRVYPTYDDETGEVLYETVGSVIYQGVIMQNSDNDGKTDSVSLTAGKYIIKAICDKHELNVTATAFYKFDTGEKSPGALGPGLRVKEMIHENSFGKTIKKSFSYIKENGYCSGELLSSTTYQVSALNDITHDLDMQNWVVSDISYLVYSATLAERSDLALQFYYKRVVENSEAGDEVHRMVYDFDYFSNTQNVEMLAKTTYNQKDTLFTPLIKDEFSFSPSYNYESCNGLEIYTRENHINVSSSGTFPGYEVYDFSIKNWVEYWKYTQSTKQTRYENGQELVTETRSFYNPAGTRNLIGTKTTLPDGKTLYTKYTYPQDYSGNGNITAMVSANMLLPVIEEQVWLKVPGALDSLLISGRINEYENLRLKAIYALESVDDIKIPDQQAPSTLISDSHYKKKVEFTYDNSGRIIAQQLTDHPVISYVWGYPGYSESGSPGKRYAHPVAEIKNAAASTVFYSSFEENTTTPINGFTGLKCKADSFKIKKSFTGSYTLTYWKKTGGNPWALVTQSLSSPSNYIISAMGSYIDEVRLYPVDAQLTTYIYRPGLGIAQVIDVNNRITSYEYDPAGRLKLVKDQAKNIINTYQYHVKNEAIVD